MRAQADQRQQGMSLNAQPVKSRGKSPIKVNGKHARDPSSRRSQVIRGNSVMHMACRCCARTPCRISL